VVCDNFFTSPQLFDSLLRRKIYATCTVKGRRIGFPSILCGFKKGEHPRSTLFWATYASRQMATTAWFDAKPVQFLSTSANPTGPVVAMRWLRGVRERIPTTPQQVEYQEHMGGVDKVDQMRRNYTVQFHSRKWWHKLFLGFVHDSSLQNEWILFSSDCRALWEKWHGGRLAFYYEVALALITPKVTLPHTVGPNNKNPGALYHSQRHPHLRRICRVCRKRQRWYCRACGFAFICYGPCFVKVHASKK
jgi:hypothetical protein